MMVSDQPAESEIHLLNILARRSDERMGDLPRKKMEDHKSLPNVGGCWSMWKDRSTFSGLISGDTGLLPW